MVNVDGIIVGITPVVITEKIGNRPEYVVLMTRNMATTPLSELRKAFAQEDIIKLNNAEYSLDGKVEFTDGIKPESHWELEIQGEGLAKTPIFKVVGKTATNMMHLGLVGNRHILCKPNSQVSDSSLGIERSIGKLEVLTADKVAALNAKLKAGKSKLINVKTVSRNNTDYVQSFAGGICPIETNPLNDLYLTFGDTFKLIYELSGRALGNTKKSAEYKQLLQNAHEKLQKIYSKVRKEDKDAIESINTQLIGFAVASIGNSDTDIFSTEWINELLQHMEEVNKAIPDKAPQQVRHGNTDPTKASRLVTPEAMLMSIGKRCLNVAVQIPDKLKFKTLEQKNSFFTVGAKEINPKGTEIVSVIQKAVIDGRGVFIIARGNYTPELIKFEAIIVGPDKKTVLGSKSKSKETKYTNAEVFCRESTVDFADCLVEAIVKFRINHKK